MYAIFWVISEKLDKVLKGLVCRLHRRRYWSKISLFVHDLINLNISVLSEQSFLRLFWYESWKKGNLSLLFTSHYVMYFLRKRPRKSESHEVFIVINLDVLNCFKRFRYERNRLYWYKHKKGWNLEFSLKFEKRSWPLNRLVAKSDSTD